MASLPTTRPGDVIRQFATELPGDLRISPERLAAAYRERERQVLQVKRSAPKLQAASREPCPFCHVPGFKGCAHFLPFDPPDRTMKHGVPSAITICQLDPADRHPLHAEMKAFCERTGMTRTALCRNAGFDSMLFPRLQSGARPLPATIAAMRAYMRDYEGE